MGDKNVRKQATDYQHFMKRTFNQRQSAIPPISTHKQLHIPLNTNHWIQKYHDIWCWKSRSWFETDTKTWHVKQINGFSILPSCCISNNTDTCTCRQTMENLHKFTSTKKPHTIILYISKLKDNLNMDTTIGRSVNDLC